MPESETVVVLTVTTPDAQSDKFIVAVIPTENRERFERSIGLALTMSKATIIPTAEAMKIHTKYKAKVAEN